MWDIKTTLTLFVSIDVYLKNLKESTKKNFQMMGNCSILATYKILKSIYRKTTSLVENIIVLILAECGLS